MTSAFHLLDSNLTPPSRLNNPFGYEPHPLCLSAAHELQKYILSVDIWQDEISKGKMFGVLVVKDVEGRLGFLAAYSGLLAERNDWPYFVPAVFDFQQPDGYFKQEEAHISDINHRIDTLTQHPTLTSLRQDVKGVETEMASQIKNYKQKIAEAKDRRNRIRANAVDIDEETERQLVKESQFMKAELHRMKRHYSTLLEVKQRPLHQYMAQIEELKKERKHRSDELQKWLFDHFIMLNAKGDTKTLTQIFAETNALIPPSGAGECCAPKLFQYAYLNHLKPICISEFWWGESPKTELRRHLQFYPACRSKCLPILTFMLKGLDVEKNTHEQPIKAMPKIIFEDDAIMVINKPAGVLSVPGKIETTSVWTFAHEHCPQANGPLIVHRLDMATSGLMVVAKTKRAHQNLQAQFKNRTVQKTYIALLDGILDEKIPRKGTINLPMRPDPTDRPRQVIDHEHGKPAVTEYEILETTPEGKTKIKLHPLTGRTHQLRLHCAHPEGLNCPIVGDTLYGKRSDRLYLHAFSIRFQHPVHGQEMMFSQPAEE